MGVKKRYVKKTPRRRKKEVRRKGVITFLAIHQDGNKMVCELKTISPALKPTLNLGPMDMPLSLPEGKLELSGGPCSFVKILRVSPFKSMCLEPATVYRAFCEVNWKRELTIVGVVTEEDFAAIQTSVVALSSNQVGLAVPFAQQEATSVNLTEDSPVPYHNRELTQDAQVEDDTDLASPRSQIEKFNKRYPTTVPRHVK